jgi:hypothetical protein
LGEIDKGAYMPGAGRVLVNSLLDDLLADYQINGKSHDWAELVVRVHPRPFSGMMKAAHVSTSAVRKYIQSRQQPEKRVYTDAEGKKTREREYGPASNSIPTYGIIRITFPIRASGTGMGNASRPALWNQQCIPW